MYRQRFTSFRNFKSFSDQNVVDDDATWIGQYHSDLIPLIGGNKYYFESWLYNGGGPGHHTIGFEVTPDSGSHNYKRASRQWMDLFVDQTLVRDTSRITIVDPDNLSYALIILDPDTLENYTVQDIEAGGSAADLKNAIKGYYKDKFGKDPDVTLDIECKDSTDTVIDCAADPSLV